MSEVGIDAGALSCHFRELQQEKKKLENKLEHLRMRRKDLESKQDVGTVEVAKMKVHETQLHVDKFQALNDEQQKTVADTKQKIKDEEKLNEQEIDSHQLKCDELAENFRSARRYYVDAVLNDEEHNWKRTIEEKQCEVKNNKELVGAISERLEKMKILKETIHEEKPAMSVWSHYLENKDVSWMLFEEESKMVENTLGKLTSSISVHNGSIKDLDENLQNLKGELGKIE